MFSLSVPIRSYICEIFIYFQDRPAYFAARKYVDQSWESQTYINVGIRTEAAQFQEKEYIKGIFLAKRTCFSFVNDVAEITSVHLYFLTW
jgi:hypothetical protein